MQNLLKNATLDYAGAAVAAGSSIDDDSTEFDMQGYESCVFFTTLTDSTDTGVATLSVEQSATSGSGHAAITGASHAATSAADDDLNGKFLAVEVVKPTQRYVRANRASATANMAYGEIYCVRLKARKVPVATPGTAASAPTVVAGS